MIPSAADARYRPYEVTVGARRGRTRGQRWTAWADRIARRRTRCDGRHDRARMTTVLGRSPISVNTLRAVYQSANATHLHLAVNRYAHVAGARPTPDAEDRRTLVIRANGGRPRPAFARPGRGSSASSRVVGSEGGAARADLRVIADARTTSSQSHAHVIDDVVRRVTRRAQRIEVTGTARRVTRARVDVMSEVARVLTAPESLTGTEAPARGNTALRTPADSLAPSPFDMEALTDQIVTRLDDRLTAHRERFGHAF